MVVWEGVFPTAIVMWLESGICSLLKCLLVQFKNSTRTINGFRALHITMEMQ